MRNDKKERKYSLPIRFLGASCTFILLGSVLYIAVAGLNFMAGFMVAASLTGLIGPSVAAGESFLEMVLGFFELILESIQTLFEAVVDFVSSIFS